MKSPNVVELRANRTERRRALHPPRSHSTSEPVVMDRAFLNQAMMLDFFGQPPLSIPRSYVDITGSVVAALWLSHALDKQASATDSGGDHVFVMTGKDCERDTGITRAQQVTCRRVLLDRGLLSEESQQGKVGRYRIHMDRLAQCLMRQAAPLAEALRRSASDPSGPPAMRHSA